jgi:hypothetical protein
MLATYARDPQLARHTSNVNHDARSLGQQARVAKAADKAAYPDQKLQMVNCRGLMLDHDGLAGSLLRLGLSGT